jgi:hypothetical protein
LNIQTKENSLDVDPSAKKFSFDISFIDPKNPGVEAEPVE